MGIPSILIDTDGMIRDINEAGLDFLGYERCDLVGEPVNELVAERTTLDDIVSTVAGGDVWSGDVEVRTADGRTVYGQGSVAPIVVDGKIERNVAAFVDARQKRQYETAAEVLNRLLRHDLKNDLNIVYGYIQQARSQTDDEQVMDRLAEARGALARVIDKSDRARDLQEFLDRAYQESTYPVRLDDVLAETVASVRAEYDHAAFTLGRVPAVQVVADDLLSTVLEGILENAVQHNDSEKPRVGVDVRTTETTAVVRVADNGPGMPTDDHEIVFGRGATDVLNHGDGVSLFFADSVVRTYEGQLWFEEHDGSLDLLEVPEEGLDGTVFKIELTRP